MGSTILISGGGIAGLAAANYLHRGGHDVTVIDKAPAFRKLGYLLALKASASRSWPSSACWTS
jgi:2-polyprenyl-6-methoxyphenol hydroxylase-like FAD-dependent oxidoreductase